MSNQCGKSCETCAVREEINCGGCRYVTDNFGCEIADCASKNNHVTCATCVLSVTCPTKRQCYSMHSRRAEKIAEEQRRYSELVERSGVLAKWLTILFWVDIAALVIGLFAGDTIAAVMPVIGIIGVAVDAAVYMAKTFILYQLRRVHASYRTAAICSFIMVPVELISVFISTESSVLQLVIDLPAAIVSTYALYCMCNAHSWVTADVDSELSDRWQFLWKLYIAVIIGTVCAPVLALFGLIGVIALLAVVVGAFVIGVFELYYLHKTARLFREIAEN